MESLISKARELRSFLQTRGHHYRVSHLKITRSNLSFRENTLAKAQRLDWGRGSRGEKAARSQVFITFNFFFCSFSECKFCTSFIEFILKCLILFDASINWIVSFIFILCILLLLSWWLSGEKSTCHAGDVDSIPGLERSHGKGNGNSLQYFCMEKPMDRGAWWATLHWFTKSWTQLNE